MKRNPESTGYTFADAVNRRYRIGTKRNALALFWLASMSKDIIADWGKGKLSDEDIMRRAHEMKLVSTGPWLEDQPL